MNTKDKTCNNCAFFCQHFSYTHNSYHIINYGHCLNDLRIKATQRVRLTVCEQWKPKDEVIAKRKESVANSLITLSKRVDEILSMINNGLLDI